MSESNSLQHSVLEDVLAIVLGTLFVALGVTFYSHSQLLTGGTAGLGFLFHYSVGMGFGFWFFVLNLPFYYLAIRRMGWRFTLKTFVAVALVSAFSTVTPQWVHFEALSPLYSAIVGSAVMGAGFLMLFRHGASLGGVNILALYLQDKTGLRAGKFQMGVDCCIVLASLTVVPLTQVGLSIVGAVILNLILAMNHRKDRYRGLS
ncbi:YitT family protein [Pokkaliibacter sp. CJK22405]|uniref:YitT family protein n=1 Tax=Pokkaliibacter sp. CJK22405 TaxID=3384615 RepID=UPI003984D4FA